MTTNAYEELEREIVKKLKGGADKDDLTLMICEREAINWSEAEALVNDIASAHRHDITLAQSPLLAGLALTTFLGGLSLIVYAGSELFAAARSLAQANPTDLGIITGSTTYIYFFGAEMGGWMLIGVVMILGSVKGMGSVWESILARLGIY